MASYLEAYGEGETKRAQRVRLFRWVLAAFAAVVIVGSLLYSIFVNYSEEQQVKQFVALLQKKDYQAAYRMWGCTDAAPCRDYSFAKFMEDWGPNSPHANAAAARVGSSDTCGTGVVIPVNFKGGESVPLWIDKGTKIIGFSPDPECQKKRWHFKEFFRSLFGKESFLQLNY